MARLIDADGLKITIRQELDIAEQMVGDEADIYISKMIEEAFFDIIDKTITIEPEQKKGEWKRSLGDLENGTVHCNSCGTEFDYYLLNQLAMESCETEFLLFCPHCGADMRPMDMRGEENGSIN